MHSVRIRCKPSSVMMATCSEQHYIIDSPYRAYLIRHATARKTCMYMFLKKHLSDTA